MEAEDGKFFINIVDFLDHKEGVAPSFNKKTLITIPYRPLVYDLTESVFSSILLQQVFYWWKISGKKPFWKFKEPCKHKLYSQGDSWCEELRFTRRQFDKALKKIGYRTKKGKPILEAKSVHYWKGFGGLTYYTINKDAKIPINNNEG